MTRNPTWLAWLLFLPACSDGDRPVREHDAVRAIGAVETAGKKRFATPDERFGMRQATDPDDPGLDFVVPEGWSGGVAGGMRILDFTVDGEPEIQCYMSSVRGEGSTLAANVNRWVGQFGQRPMDRAALAALPVQRIFGLEAHLVELTGAVSDPMTKLAIDDAALLGVVFARADGCLTFKMVGPREAVLSRKDQFLGLVASVRLKDTHGGGANQGTGRGASGSPGGVGPGAGAAGATSVPMFSNGLRALSGTWPGDWTKEDRAMRLMSFKIGEATELAVSAFGGGVRDNVNRWRGQMGLPALTNAEIQALPSMAVLGGEGMLSVMDGHMRDGMTNTDLPGATMLGLIAPQPGGENLFVKMWGPAAEVAARRGEYEAFVASLTDVGAGGSAGTGTGSGGGK